MRTSYEYFGHVNYVKLPRNWFSKKREIHKKSLLNFDKTQLKDHNKQASYAYNRNMWTYGSYMEWILYGDMLYKISQRYQKYLNYLNNKVGV